MCAHGSWFRIAAAIMTCHCIMKRVVNCLQADKQHFKLHGLRSCVCGHFHVLAWMHACRPASLFLMKHFCGRGHQFGDPPLHRGDRKHAGNAHYWHRRQAGKPHDLRKEVLGLVGVVGGISLKTWIWRHACMCTWHRAAAFSKLAAL